MDSLRNMQRRVKHAAIMFAFAVLSGQAAAQIACEPLPLITDEGPIGSAVDGDVIWVMNRIGGTVQRFRISDGEMLARYAPVTSATAVVVLEGIAYVAGTGNPASSLYKIDPDKGVTLLTNRLGALSASMAFDGTNFWVANSGIIGGTPSNVSIVPFDNPAGVVNVGGFVQLRGIVFDGKSIWVTDEGTGELLKLNGDGSVARRFAIGTYPLFPTFDGTNIWVPDWYLDMVAVVNTQTEEVTYLAGNGINIPFGSAFDGKRVFVTNLGGRTVSAWRAADLEPLGSASIGIDADPFTASGDAGRVFATSYDGDSIIKCE